MKKKSIYKAFSLIFWTAFVIVYPALISIYVTLPLFVGFSGYMFIKGIEEEKSIYTLFSFIYMLMLEVNLSLPLLLLPISAMIFYIFIKKRLSFLKLCPKCISVISVVLINLIYFFLIANIDLITSQSSVNYNSLILYSILFDIVAAVLV